MTVYQLNPLEDPRWELLSLQHPSASVFHTSAWLRALQLSYGYQPVVLTTSSPEEDLTNGIVFCRVKSRITGNRLVSLPFSDHCEPLFGDPNELASLLSMLKTDRVQKDTKYVEIRPLHAKLAEQSSFEAAETFWHHRIDLRTPTDTLFLQFHTNIQRNIKRAEQKFLRYETGRSNELLHENCNPFD